MSSKPKIAPLPDPPTPTIPGDGSPADMARALAQWAAEAEELLRAPPGKYSAALAERVTLAWRVANWGRDGRESDAPAHARYIIERALRDAADGYTGASADAVRCTIVRDAIATAGLSFVPGVTDETILTAVHAVNNRGGYGVKAKVKLVDALEALWDALGIPASGSDRTTRRLKYRRA